jgi:hypothetical protein
MSGDDPLLIAGYTSIDKIVINHLEINEQLDQLHAGMNTVVDSMPTQDPVENMNLYLCNVKIIKLTRRHVAMSI